jgi:hypothetical protein
MFEYELQTGQYICFISNLQTIQQAIGQYFKRISDTVSSIINE